MTIVANTRRITAACAALAALLICAKAAQPLKLDFSEDTVGAEPKAFLSVVGVWRIEAEKNNKVLAVDGRQWKEGQTSAGIADKARALYGDRYAEFLDRVQAYGILPLHRGQGRDRFPRRRKSRSGNLTKTVDGPRVYASAVSACCDHMAAMARTISSISSSGG